MNIISWIPTYIAFVRALIATKLARKTPEAQIIKLEHILYVRTRQHTQMMRTPWSVSSEDIVRDIKRYEEAIQQRVIDVGCDLNAHAATRELVEKIRLRLL
jgi:hypothetical protein